MPTTTVNIQITGLGKQKMAELTRKAERLGLTPSGFVRRLVEEDLALDRAVRATTLAELMGPGREVNEAELDRLVEEARSRHHALTSGKT